MNYRWDTNKARTNLLKHGIDFADAVTVLGDDSALTIEDEQAVSEQRWVTLGMDLFGRILVVVFCYQEEDIRIISARRATKTEKKTYDSKKRI